MRETVAPFAGAWIEMEVGRTDDGLVDSSLPSRERGLKLYNTSIK